jgi:hypothetical protein
MAPIFLKNGGLLILYPDSKMIGGRSKIIKSLTKWLDKFVIYDSMFMNLRINPATTPISVVSPDSCKYLCFLFFKKWPPIIDNINKKSIMSISELTSI